MAILETALTLPIVLYIVFFSIELIRMELAQTAVDSITKEFTFYLMAKGKIVASEVDAIFEKYRPWGISIGHFKYYIRIYADDDVTPMTPEHEGIYKMMTVSPYGGETIGWAGTDYAKAPNKQPTDRANDHDYKLKSNHALLKKYQTKLCEGSAYNEYGSGRQALLESENGMPKGTAFVLTVAVKFPFSSPFVAKLFGGGTNTNRAGVYILWARGSGLVN